MEPFSDHMPVKQINKLRAAHQAAAKLTAATGTVPKAFLGDPTFSELVLEHSNPAPEIGSGLLVEIENDKPAVSSG